ncbi:MAG: Crp/Fnr family transcriptional regulator [Xanthobacteraceae bacterium]
MQAQGQTDSILAPRPRDRGVSSEQNDTDARRTIGDRLGIDISSIAPEFRRARQAIFRRNDICEDICIISEGWAYRYLQLADGRRQILAVLLPGDVIAASTPFQPRMDYSVQALTDVRFHRIHRSLFTARETQAKLFGELAKILVAERKNADDQLIDLGQRPADERIAGLILRLRDRLDARGEVENETFRFPLRQQHIADIAGLTSVHVSRVLTQLRKDGLVDIADGMIHLHNLPELRRLGELR